jgi:hypothetical protein
LTRTTPNIPKDIRHGIFKKDRSCQLHRNGRSHSLEYRRLRFSFQINDFKDPPKKTGRHCLTPVSGGGGDLGASVVQVKKFLGRNSPVRPDPEVGGGGFLRKSVLRVNRAFQPIRRSETGASRPQKIVVRSERLPSCIVSDGSIGARRLFGLDRGSKKFLRLLFSPGPFGSFRFRGPDSQPVSGRGGSIRRPHFVRKRLFRGKGKNRQTWSL